MSDKMAAKIINKIDLIIVFFDYKSVLQENYLNLPNDNISPTPPHPANEDLKYLGTKYSYFCPSKANQHETISCIPNLGAYVTRSNLRCWGRKLFVCQGSILVFNYI